MPPIKKYDRETIINIASKIVEKEGYKGLNARRLAKELGSSVNPIFNNFTSMEELQSEVTKRIVKTYEDVMLEGAKHEKSYKGIGLAYINFAKNYPEYFKILFMSSINEKAETLVDRDLIVDTIIEAGQKLTGFTYEEQKEFHIKVWMLTHGIACMLATRTVDLKDEDVDRLLEESVREMVVGRKALKGANR